MLYVQTVWKGLAMPEDCFQTIKHCVDVTHLKMEIILYFALSINFLSNSLYITGIGNWCRIFFIHVTIVPDGL